MIDTFVLLPPPYLLGVIALLGFVGCSFSVGIAPEAIAGPVLRCTADDQTVELNWDPVGDAIEYHVKRSETMGGAHDPIGNPVLPPHNSASTARRISKSL